ncbi:MAG: GAF domain-containing protein [Sulfitobacter sp.]
MHVYACTNLLIQRGRTVKNLRKNTDQRNIRDDLARAYEREAASQEILQIISQRRDDDTPVLEAIVRSAARLTNAKVAGISLANVARTHLSYAATWGPQHDLFPNGFQFDLSGPLQVAETVREARLIHTLDLADSALYREGDPVRRNIVDEVGIRTFLTVPLIQDGIAFGCLNLNRDEVRPFSANEIQLVETFATQAVIAIENVRQFRELQVRLEREAATSEILSVISQSRDDEARVFDIILRKASSLCNADQAGLQIVNDNRSKICLAGHCGHQRAAFELGQEWPFDSPLSAGVAIRSAKVFHIPDYAETDLYKNGDPTAVHTVETEGVRTRVVVPLLQNGIAIGTISLSRHEVRPFEASEIQLVETFAAQAVIAIENVRQFKALEAFNAELGDRVEAQVGEIERMGRLKRFLPSAVADTIVSSGSEEMLKSHRAMLGVLFCDIRGFTAFCETAEPEETIEVLQAYHEEMGRLIKISGAGVDHRMGDGIMVLFNDPLPCDDPASEAVRLAIAMRERMAELSKQWKRLGHRLGFG